jgi:predicted DCC family thiol-disulfide oxidoreductase YuxK
MNTNEPKGWILYDDSCGFCRRWIPFWEGALMRRGFAVAPLQADWVRQRTGLSEEGLLQDLLLLLADGTIIRGADVYRYATRRIWWAWPIYLFSITPVLRGIFDWSYRTFARNRFKVSTLCKLPPAEKK